MISFSIFQKPVTQIKCGHKVSAVFLHLGDSCIVNVRTVLDRIHARLRSPENALSSMGMGSDFSTEAMSICHDSLHLFQRVLGGLRVVAFRKHSAGRADLDQVGTVLNVLAYFVLD